MQQRLPSGYNLQKFYLLLAETEHQGENKASVCACVCVCASVFVRVCVRRNFIENCQCLDQASLSDSGFNNLMKEVAVEAFDGY